ncbi:ferredoxin [Streptomyces sp. NPDC051896]|uniref:ferredoxin n=1 Tax=Streptomyces sp. NPDC051896 TaxID=3155416 RepID=UPI003412C892
MTSTPSLHVNRITCTGQGLCAELLPELIDLGEWGYPILKDPAVPDQLRAHARQAVAACHRLSLHIDRGRP